MSDVSSRRFTVDRASRPQRSRRRASTLIVVCGVVVVAAVVCAVFGDIIAPLDPTRGDLRAVLQTPTLSHPFGTDDSGRDIFSRLVAGARSAVLGPAIVAMGSAVIGGVLGLVAGYCGGWRDTVVMRSMELIYALPALLVAIVLVGVLGGGYAQAVAILVVLTAPVDARVVRGATLQERSLPYVDAARTLGLSQWRIMFGHIWPNCLPLVVANAFLNFAYSLVTLSALSFLGLGVAPGAPDWGRMLGENLSFIETVPLAALAPGLCLVSLAVATNLIGDWSYEKLAGRGRAQ
jgi:peptide/nickel transport system permease protein